MTRSDVILARLDAARSKLLKHSKTHYVPQRIFALLDSVYDSVKAEFDRRDQPGN